MPNKSKVTPIPEADAPSVGSEEVKVTEPQVVTSAEVAEPNEAFFGTLLIGCLVISLLSATGYFAYSGYRYLKSIKAEEAIPSIGELPTVETQKEVAAESTPTTEEKVTPEVTETKKETIDKKLIELKVLNGGTAKGVAGTYVEKLKKDGFTKTVVGNSFGSYTGATLYYAKGQEANLAALKEVVMKDYPAVIEKPAVSGDKDTTAAPIVLILGR